MKDYMKNFMRDESGIEMMEWIAVLAVGAVLILICTQVAKKVKTRTKGIAGKI